MSLEKSIDNLTAQLKRFNDYLEASGAPGTARNVTPTADEAPQTATGEKVADPKVATKADPKPAGTKTEAKEPSEADVKQLVVKLVTKIGREPTIAFMNESFGAPNVSGAVTAGHKLSAIKKVLDTKLAEEPSPAE